MTTVCVGILCFAAGFSIGGCVVAAAFRSSLDAAEKRVKELRARTDDVVRGYDNYRARVDALVKRYEARRRLEASRRLN